jgi:predicted metal-dependent peptidase
MDPEPLGTEHDYDMASLERELDRTKSQIFLGNNAAFYAPLMCSMEFVWTEHIPTAATNGATIWWNPRWFLSLVPETRRTVLVHELMHVALLHLVRGEGRDQKIWNYACDIRINNDLERERYSFAGVEGCWKDQSFGDMPAEEIYDILYQRKQDPQCAPWGTGGDEGDMQEPDKATKQKVIASVVQASHQARLSGQAGSIPGETKTYLKKFLEPKLPWETLLYLWFNELGQEDYTWARPNRRYQEMYLPSLQSQHNGLEHLAYYLDVSGSVSDHDVLRFNSEVKFIKETFNPQKLTLVQFDTRITATKVFTEDDPFDEIVVVGRGGTCLVPVRDHILEHRPTAAVIFSDLYVPPMEPVGNIPVLWVAVGNQNARVNFGKLIHISG